MSPTTTGDPVTIAADRKSTRLNSSHSQISYAVFCLKKKKKNDPDAPWLIILDRPQQRHLSLQCTHDQQSSPYHPLIFRILKTYQQRDAPDSVCTNV